MANEDKATRYHRLRRRASVLATVLGALLLLGLLTTGWSAALRDLAMALAAQSFFLALTLYVIMVALLSELVQLPLAFYLGVTLERRYGLSTQATARWWLDRLKAGGVALVFALAGALIVLYLLRWSPENWWLIAAGCFAFVLVLLAQLAPVVLLPLFYAFKPLDRPNLSGRLAALAERADVRVIGVFEWRLSDRTRKANAALAGMGRTRRILLSDTLLADHGDEEIEVILAHELAHHVHRDIWKSIALEIALIALGFYLADLALSAAAERFGMASKDDIAGLPLLVLVAGAASLALLPLANAFSRAHERRRGSLRAGDDEERRRVRQRDEAARGTEPRGGAALAARRAALLLASVDGRANRCRAGVGEGAWMISAGTALERLRTGNHRFVSNLHRDAPTNLRRRNGLAGEQEPFAIVLGCSDARVPAEIVFDQGLGELFVIRVAGNIVASSQVGSVEFAAARFGVRLVVVLGHSQCGAVLATLGELQQPTGNQSRYLRSIVDRVRPSVEALLTTDLKHDPHALVRQAVRANIRVSANHLRHGSEVLEQLIQKDGLIVVGAEYSLETGVVEFFDGAP